MKKHVKVFEYIWGEVIEKTKTELEILMPVVISEDKAFFIALCNQELKHKFKSVSGYPDYTFKIYKKDGCYKALLMKEVK